MKDVGVVENAGGCEGSENREITCHSAASK